MYTIEVMHSVAIIIVNWNTGRRLADCLKALHELSDRDLIAQAVVVDNQSTDNSCEFGKAACDGTLPVTFLQLDDNLGFARGNNLGIEALSVLVKKKSHILFLNPDTQVQDGALRELNSFFDRYSKTGVVGAHLLNPDKSTQPSVRQLPSWQVLTFMLLRLQRLMPNAKIWREYMMSDFNYEQEVEVEQVMGACMLVRQSVWTLVGELDIGFSPYWFEDVDYCKRVLEADYQVWYAPEARVIHYGGVSFHQVVGLKRTWPWVRNTVVYASRHLGWMTTMWLGLLVPVSLLLSFLGLESRRQQRIINKNRLS